jgi:hypothetical protein
MEIMRRLVITEPFKSELTQFINDLQTVETQEHTAKKHIHAQLKSATDDHNKEDLKTLKIAFEQAKIKRLAAKSALISAQKVVEPFLVEAETFEKKKQKTTQPVAEKAIKETVVPKESEKTRSKKTPKLVGKPVE